MHLDSVKMHENSVDLIVRYPRDLRDDPGRIATQVLVPTMDGAQVPLGQLAKVELAKGAPVIRTENALLPVYIYVDMRGPDIGGYVADAQRAVRDAVKFPPGYYVTWSGQFEYLERAQKRLALVVPAMLMIIFVMLYLTFQRMDEALLILATLPFSLIVGVWLLYALGHEVSVATAVGFIGLAGVTALNTLNGFQKPTARKS